MRSATRRSRTPARAPPSALSASARREDTTLPPDVNPRARALALQLRAAAGSDADFVAATLDYLARGGFVYSLEPQPLGARHGR